MKMQTKFHKMGPALQGLDPWLALQGQFAVMAYNEDTGEYRVLGTVYNDPQDHPQSEHPLHPATQPIAVTTNCPDGTNENVVAAALALVQDHPALPEGPWQLELFAMEGWFSRPN